MLSILAYVSLGLYFGTLIFVLVDYLSIEREIAKGHPRPAGHNKSKKSRKPAVSVE